MRSRVRRVDCAFTICAAIEVGVHESGLEVGHELFVDALLANPSGDLVRDYSKTRAELVDKAKKSPAMHQRGPGVE